MANHYLPCVHFILGGDFTCEIIDWNQKWLAGDFKTESLMYRGDIHSESLLTMHAFDSWQGFHLQNH